MNKIIFIFLFFFLFQNSSSASNKTKIINKLNKTENLSFKFIQTINDKNEKGKCTIKYPKKIYCEYDKKITESTILIAPTEPTRTAIEMKRVILKVVILVTNNNNNNRGLTW